MDNVLRFYWGNSKFSVALLLEYNLFLDAEKQTAASKSYKPSQDLHTLNILQAQSPVVCYPKHYRVFRYLRPPPEQRNRVDSYNLCIVGKQNIIQSRLYLEVLSMHCRFCRCTVFLLPVFRTAPFSAGTTEGGDVNFCSQLQNLYQCRFYVILIQ